MIGIDPWHRRDHLSLLPSGPDEFHGLLLQGDRSESPIVQPAGRNQYIYKLCDFFSSLFWKCAIL